MQPCRHTVYNHFGLPFWRVKRRLEFCLGFFKIGARGTSKCREYQDSSSKGELRCFSCKSSQFRLGGRPTVSILCILRICIYMYTFIYIYMCVCVWHRNLYVYSCIHIYLHTLHMNMYICIYMYIYLCIYMYAISVCVGSALRIVIKRPHRERLGW